MEEIIINKDLICIDGCTPLERWGGLVNATDTFGGGALRFINPIYCFFWFVKQVGNLFWLLANSASKIGDFDIDLIVNKVDSIFTAGGSLLQANILNYIIFLFIAFIIILYAFSIRKSKKLLIRFVAFVIIIMLIIPFIINRSSDDLEEGNEEGAQVVLSASWLLDFPIRTIKSLQKDITEDIVVGEIGEDTNSLNNCNNYIFAMKKYSTTNNNQPISIIISSIWEGTILRLRINDDLAECRKLELIKKPNPLSYAFLSCLGSGGSLINIESSPTATCKWNLEIIPDISIFYPTTNSSELRRKTILWSSCEILEGDNQEIRIGANPSGLTFFKSLPGIFRVLDFNGTANGGACENWWNAERDIDIAKSRGGVNCDGIWYPVKNTGENCAVSLEYNNERIEKASGVVNIPKPGDHSYTLFETGFGNPTFPVSNTFDTAYQVDFAVAYLGLATFLTTLLFVMLIFIFVMSVNVGMLFLPFVIVGLLFESTSPTSKKILKMILIAIIYATIGSLGIAFLSLIITFFFTIIFTIIPLWDILIVLMTGTFLYIIVILMYLLLRKQVKKITSLGMQKNTKTSNIPKNTKDIKIK